MNPYDIYYRIADECEQHGRHFTDESVKAWMRAYAAGAKRMLMDLISDANPKEGATGQRHVVQGSAPARTGEDTPSRVPEPAPPLASSPLELYCELHGLQSNKLPAAPQS